VRSLSGVFRPGICDLHVAAHTKIDRYSGPQNRPRAAGQNQEPPQHPHGA
jgi:hypothetical protein